MIKNSNISFENYVSSQFPSRDRVLRTNSSYKQNHLIRCHLAEWLLHHFNWQYWVTFTFGFNPILDEVQDILWKSHHRIDQRILKHTKHLTVLEGENRSRWILFPEYAGRGLHYHGFIELNVKPNIKKSSYPSEWWWMEAALRNTLEGMTPFLSEGGPITFHHYDRGYRTKDQLKMILYSMKEYGKGASHHDQEPDQDRFAHTIISWVDWKTSPIHKHRTPNKLSEIPPRPDKILPHSLESFFN